MTGQILQLSRPEPCRCLRCDHEWKARDEYWVDEGSREDIRDTIVPDKCPNCYSPFWLSPPNPEHDKSLTVLLYRLLETIEKLRDDNRTLGAHVLVTQVSFRRRMEEIMFLLPKDVQAELRRERRSPAPVEATGREFEF